ncbi:MAG: hypothetical protein ACI9U2_000290 [Bradymonadia bacterium]|jgi:hypothetical protein
MSGHDWEALHGQLEQATGSWSRDELVGLLRDLIREYVIERGLPTGTAAQAASPDVSAMDFPGLITWLKRASSLPEMDLFQIDGRRVLVDADGPRELSLDRATELRPRSGPAPRPPAQAAPRPNTTSARPQRAATPAEPEGTRGAASNQTLKKGFRGLEFD